MEEKKKLCFFLSMKVFKGLNAVTFMLQKVREFYPDEDIFIFESGSAQMEPLCKQFNCHLIQRDRDMFKFLKVEGCVYDSLEMIYQMFNDLHHCGKTANAEWVLKLEPDVVIRGRIKNFPTDEKVAIAGLKFKFNYYHPFFPPHIRRMRLEKGFPLVKDNLFSFCGGSIVRTTALETIISRMDEVKAFSEANPKFSTHDDVIVSFWVNCFGYDIVDWDETMEEKFTQDVKRRIMAPVVHGFKYFY